jgi:hypothetical protein
MNLYLYSFVAAAIGALAYYIKIYNNDLPNTVYVFTDSKFSDFLDEKTKKDLHDISNLNNNDYKIKLQKLLNLDVGKNPFEMRSDLKQLHKNKNISIVFDVYGDIKEKDKKKNISISFDDSDDIKDYANIVLISENLKNKDLLENPIKDFFDWLSFDNIIKNNSTLKDELKLLEYTSIISNNYYSESQKNDNETYLNIIIKNNNTFRCLFLKFGFETSSFYICGFRLNSN